MTKEKSLLRGGPDYPLRIATVKWPIGRSLQISLMVHSSQKYVILTISLDDQMKIY